MKSNKIALQLRLDEQTHRKVTVISNNELRSFNSQIEYFVLKGIAEYEKEHGPISPEEQS